MRPQRNHKGSPTTRCTHPCPARRHMTTTNVAPHTQQPTLPGTAGIQFAEPHRPRGVRNSAHASGALGTPAKTRPNGNNSRLGTVHACHVTSGAPRLPLRQTPMGRPCPTRGPPATTRTITMIIAGMARHPQRGRQSSTVHPCRLIVPWVDRAPTPSQATASLGVTGSHYTRKRPRLPAFPHSSSLDDHGQGPPHPR